MVPLRLVVGKNRTLMIRRSSGSCLLLQELPPVGTSGRERRQDLDRRVAPQTRITGAGHLAHVARTEQRLNLIVAEILRFSSGARDRGARGQWSKHWQRSEDSGGTSSRSILFGPDRCGGFACMAI